MFDHSLLVNVLSIFLTLADSLEGMGLVKCLHPNLSPVIFKGKVKRQYKENIFYLRILKHIVSPPSSIYIREARSHLTVVMSYKFARLTSLVLSAYAERCYGSW